MNSRSIYLERRGLHRKGIWRRECACFDHVPFGLLTPSTDVSEPPIMVEPVPLPAPVLTSWAEYFSARNVAEDSALALVLHVSLTIYYMLYELGVVNAETGAVDSSTLRIDYLGPERELDMLSTLRYRYLLFDGVC